LTGDNQGRTMTNDDLKALAVELQKESLDNLRANQGSVSKALENPWTWIGFITVLGGFIAILVYNTYRSDADSLSGRIKSNTQAIAEIQAIQRETATLVLKMQGNQETISRQIESNANKLDRIGQNYDGLLNSRFTTDDGDRLYKEVQDFAQRHAENILREFTEMKSDVKTLESKVDELRFMESRVNQVNDTMKELKTKVDSTENRLRMLESN